MRPSAAGSLKERLARGKLVVAAGVFDMISLRIADRMGFDALYMTGYGTVASHLGLPDAGLATYSDMLGRVTAMAGTARTPLIADGDTGYGGLLNVQHTVRGYEAAGAAAIQIEDQEVPVESRDSKPLVANMVEKGRTPLLPAQRLQEIGYSLAIFPATAFLAAGAAMEKAYQRLQDQGSSASIADELYEFDRFSRLMGFEAVWEFERSHAE